MFKTEGKLSRNSDDEDMTESTNEEICRLDVSKVTDDRGIAIDPGDITKNHPKKTEFLGNVRGESEEEIDEGDHLCKAVATDIELKKIIPLYCGAYFSLRIAWSNDNRSRLNPQRGTL